MTAKDYVRSATYVVLSLAVLFFAGQVVAEDAPAQATCPEDLGPSEVDVSGYPAEYQRAYREIFIPVFEKLGGAARQINSPLIEMDPLTEKAEKGRNPALFSDERVARVSPDAWKKFVNQVRTRPPCCGACPVVSLSQAQALWRFLVYDSLARKTGPRAAEWIRHRETLLARFREGNPGRYKELFEEDQDTEVHP